MLSETPTSAGLVQEEKSSDLEEAVDRQNTSDTFDSGNDQWVVKWDGVDDPQCPLNTALLKKWTVTTVVSVSAAYLTACSSLASFTYPAMEAEFGVSRLVCTLSVSLFVLGMAIGPLLTGPISEFTGRRRVLLCSIVCNFLLNIPVAFANNISVHLVFRFLSGFAGAAFGAVSGGVISDVFPNKKVGTPMIIFTTVMLIGPVIGAIISALINANANWRWTYITVIIWAFVLSMLVYFLVPETSAAQLLTQKARRRRRETGEGKWQSPAEREDRSVLLAFRHSLGTPFGNPLEHADDGPISRSVVLINLGHIVPVLWRNPVYVHHAIPLYNPTIWPRLHRNWAGRAIRHSRSAAASWTLSSRCSISWWYSTARGSPCSRDVWSTPCTFGPVVARDYIVAQGSVDHPYFGLDVFRVWFGARAE
ncbi:hypothetical protein C349_07215 [Cryptococcus neoformans var. grubii Br795]|nr:hypothetical protein C349_07215 [Cryptococcus neoformans var. grubii Br795]